MSFSKPAHSKETEVLSKLLGDLPAPLGEIARDPKHEVQILYVQVDQNDDNVEFTEHGWGLDSDRYFYPASTVKFPVAIFALEKLNGLGIPGLNRDTTMLTEAAEPWQTERLVDASSHSGMPSIAQDLRKIFLVSDNDSYNRLYEFVGSELIHKRFRELGLRETFVFHRLSVGDNGDRGRRGNPIRFLGPEGALIHSQPDSLAPEIYRHGKEVRKGRGFFKNGELVNEPMDFSDLNSFPIADQHRLLRNLFYPGPDGLKIKDDNRKFLQKVMGQYPRENGEVIDEEIRKKPDLYVKNFLRWMEPPVRGSLRCYNKSGRAYGYLTDNAYVVDREHGISFFLAATIHVNANQIFNDNIYEYEKMAEPFMAELGKAIYHLELKRRK